MPNETCYSLLLAVFVIIIINKKLRYREEHSASVVLIVGVLYDIYRETNNISTANQPLVRNWP